MFPEVVILDACGNDTAYMHGNQHAQHPKKHKKLPEPTTKNSEKSYTDA